MPLFKLNEGLETVAHNAIGNFLMGDHTRNKEMDKRYRS